MRSQVVLRDGWWIRPLDTGPLDTGPLDGAEPDVAALSAEARAPGPAWLPATMPAQVHDILLAHGRISDPRVGTNAADSAWVGERDWVYATHFRTPQNSGSVLLRFAGLDTLATVCVNGTEVGRAANMHRHYAFEVQQALRPVGQENVLLIVFASPLRFVAEAETPAEIPAYHAIRKCRSDFTSYLGARPHSAKVGLFDDVVLDVPDGPWFENVWARPRLSENRASAEVDVTLAVRGDYDEVAWRLVDPAGTLIADEVTLSEVDAFTIQVPDPELWWPRTHGTPALYALELSLYRGEALCDRHTVTFGIRDVQAVLADPESGQPRFAFEINGERIFLRGACWAPLQGMTHCWDAAHAEQLLDLVEQGEMNVLRVWGGGTVPPQAFYEACDRRGILIWQDFMFGYGMYPDGDAAFLENCRAELEDVVTRLRTHPSILLWCGGNENYMGWDFSFGTAPTLGRTVFEMLMPDICARLDPDRLFHPSSPYGGPVPNWPLEGDWHDYTTLTFSPQASVPLFASEIGRVSAPSVTSMRRFMSEAELWPAGHDPRVRMPGQPAWPPMWQTRSVDGSWDKVAALEAYLDPVSAEDLVRVLGTAHGEYLQQRVERHRRGVPDGAFTGTGAADRRCWGTTIWRLNDPWPILYWSAVDAYNEPKIPYYYLRRAYAPVLVCFERTADTIAVWVVNDGPEPAAGMLTLRCARFDGEVRDARQAEVDVAPGQAHRCLEVAPFGPINLRNEFLWATLEAPGTMYAATGLLIGERYLHLPESHLTVRPVPGGVELATDAFARQVTLEMEGVTGAVFEDNYFDLPPGEKRRIGFRHAAGGRTLRTRAINAAQVVLSLTEWA